MGAKCGNNTSSHCTVQHFSEGLNKMEPLCVINNITLTTDAEIIILSDDVNIYPVVLSGAIIAGIMFLIG